jgi:Na+-driven multidrug efflux pump
MNGIWQAFCLANLDIVTPIRAVVAASLMNIVGDVAFVPRYGVAGAATATAMSTVVAATILGMKSQKIIQNWRQQQIAPTLQSKNEETTIVPNSTLEISDSLTEKNATQASTSSLSSTATTSTTTPTSTTSITPPPPYWSWPDRTSATQLFGMAGPIFFVLVAKIVCYGAMTIKCTEFGVQALAAHALWMRIFYFFACFGDSLSQTAQAFLPATLLYSRYTSTSSLNEHNRDNSSFQRVFRKLLWVAMGLGIANSQISTMLLKRLGKFFTNDGSIIEYMRAHHGSAGLMMGLSILLHPFIMLLEGTVIACRDFTSLLVIYTMTLGLHFGFLQYFSGSFAAVWRTLFLFQCTRLGLYAWRVRKSTMDASTTAN